MTHKGVIHRLTPTGMWMQRGPGLQPEGTGMPDEAPRKTRSQYAVRALRNGRTRARNHTANGDLIAALAAQEKAAYTAERWLTGAHAQDHVTVEGHDVYKKRKKLIKRSLLTCPLDEEQAVTQG